MNPVISVFATSIRPRHWLAFYENIKAATQHPFEIVFSGPEKPTFELPENFRWIPTSVKPAQAMEVARLHCDGEYLVQAVDDVLFSPEALDKMVLMCAKTAKTIASCVYYANGGDMFIAQTEGIFGSCGEFSKVATNAPLQPVCPMVPRSCWPDMDPIFCAQYGELDGFLRLIKSGWQVGLVNAKVMENSAGSDLWRTKGQGDLRTIRMLWRDPSTCDFDPSRRGIPGRYDVSTIATVSQGVVF